MKSVSSYKVKIIGRNIAFARTITVWRDAIAFLVQIVNKHWEEIGYLETAKDQLTAVEYLVHSTKSRKAVYDFDGKFPKMPSYFRRAAINQSLEIVSAHKTNLEQEKKHTLPKIMYSMPVFYRKEMSRCDPENSDTVRLKLFSGSDWI